jgi:hypothetical protein
MGAGGMWWYSNELLEVAVKGNETYEITVWYLTAGVAYELRSSLE